MSTIEDKRIRWLVSVAQQHTCLKPPVLLILFVGMVTVDAMTWLQCIADSGETESQEAQQDCEAKSFFPTGNICRKSDTHQRNIRRTGGCWFTEIHDGKPDFGMEKRQELYFIGIVPRSRGKPAAARESPTWIGSFCWYCPEG